MNIVLGHVAHLRFLDFELGKGLSANISFLCTDDLTDYSLVSEQH